MTLRTLAKTHICRISAALAVSVLGGIASALAADDAILVLDGSGSMWGQIEGTTKIEIAREVTNGLLDDLPTDRKLGLIAYGHNRKGDCADIEELAAIGADRQAIKEAVGAISPKGKTPLSASVKMAAEKLKYTEQKATVILVSDGIETCDLDPCAVGTALEEAGVDFTAHVIGFDVTEVEAEKQLQCLAQNTGGRYISASNAGELSIALNETVVNTEPAAATGTVSLAASELEGGPEITSGLKWIVQQAGGGDVVFEVNDTGSASSEVPAGVYDVFVERLSDQLKGEQKLVEVPPATDKRVTIALKLDFEASVRPAPEATTPAGTEFAVYWEGPNRKNDFVTIARTDMSPGATISYQYVTRGNPLKLTAPTTPGEYEIRYVLGKPYRILAAEKMTITEVTATVTGPAEATAGSQIPVEWTGPNTDRDYITVVTKGADAGAYESYSYTVSGSPTKLVAPLAPGDYELRYIQQGTSGQSGGEKDKILASTDIKIVAAEASVSGPETAMAGQTISISWTGPDQARDFVTIVKADAADRAYNDYAYTKSGPKLNVKTPVEPGVYEIRYVQNNSKVIARQSIEVTALDVALESPATAKVGAPVTIKWTAPVEAKDWVTITPPDFAENRYTNYAYTNKGNPSIVTAPLTPGDYEARFVLNGTKVIARAPIKIEDVSVTLTAPDQAPVGSKVLVSWEGPNYKKDWVAIVKTGAPDNAYRPAYAYVNQERSQVELTAPSDPGTYELRYVLHGGRVMARQPITITAAE